METEVGTEKTLMVVADWGLLGSFGLCFILSGFSGASLVLGLVGFGLVIGALVAHVVINWRFGTGFSERELVTGFIAFAVGVLLFILNWFFQSDFGTTQLLLGLIGFGAIVLAFFGYVVTNFGLKGAFSTFHHPRNH